MNKKTYRILKGPKYFILQVKAFWGWKTLTTSWSWKYVPHHVYGYPFTSLEQTEEAIPNYEEVKKVIKRKIIKEVEV